MDFYGEINLQQNAMQQMVVQTETNFPETPVVGRVVFKDAKLYMCVAINNLIPVWLPLTNKIDTYVHSEAVAATTWTVNHGMNTTIPLIQVYDEEGEMLIPESATPLDNNNMTITFNTAVAGTAIVLFGELIPQSGVGLLEPAVVYNIVIGFTIDNPNAYGTSANDNFADVVDISPNYIVVGAKTEVDAGGPAAGKAYIFDATTGALLHTLDNPNAFGISFNDQFGNAVAITDTYTAVAASREDDAGGTDSGKVYVFNTLTGALLTTIHNPNPYGTSNNDFFGAMIALTDTHLAVGSPGEDDATDASVGRIYIFNPATGALLNTLTNPNPVDPAGGDRFGQSISVSNTYLIAGAEDEDEDIGNADYDSGKAYIFNIATGALLHTLNNPNAFGTGEYDNFGADRAIGITDTHVIVGAEREDDAGGSKSGKAYIFDATTGALLHTLDNPNAFGTSPDDTFGVTVAINNSLVAVAARTEGDAGGTNSGKVYIFNISTGALIETLDNPNVFDTSQSDFFGNALAMTEDKIVVGAFFEDDAGGTNSGKAYLYTI